VYCVRQLWEFIALQYKLFTKCVKNPPTERESESVRFFYDDDDDDDRTCEQKRFVTVSRRLRSAWRRRRRVIGNDCCSTLCARARNRNALTTTNERTNVVPYRDGNVILFLIGPLLGSQPPRRRRLCPARFLPRVVLMRTGRRCSLGPRHLVTLPGPISRTDLHGGRLLRAGPFPSDFQDFLFLFFLK